MTKTFPVEVGQTVYLGVLDGYAPKLRAKKMIVGTITKIGPDSSHPLRSGVPGDHSTFQRKVRKRVPCDQSKPTVGSASTPVLVAAIMATHELALR